MLVISSLTASAQPPFETHYGSSSAGGDGYSTEMVTCASIDPNNYTYAAVHAIRDLNVTPPAYMIRGVRIKSDGTMYTSNFDYIRESSGDYDVFPLKIIPINNNTEYMITGYVTHTNTPNLPHPFVIRTDAALAAFEFKVFTDHPGFFTDVDQLSGGDFIFCGSMTNSLQILANYRLGWMLRTDNTYAKQWMRYTYSYNHSSSVMRKDFDIVHDLILIDDDSAIVCGNITEQEECDGYPGLDSSSNIAFIAKVNLYDGSFGWYKSRLKLSNAVRLAMNSSGTMIALATTGELSNNYPGVSFWDRSGNYLYGNRFEYNPLNGVNFNQSGNNYTVNILTHVSIIQNIYFTSDDENLFISGKFIDAHVNLASPPGTQIATIDIPYNVFYNLSSATFGNTKVYVSSQQFNNGFSNLISYKKWSNGSNCPHKFTQLHFASNTLPCLSNCGTDEFITVTLDVAPDANTTQLGPDKVWIFSNDTNPCGYENNSTIDVVFPIFPVSLVMYNDNILVTPDVDTYYYNNLTPTSYNHNCEQ